MCSAGWGDGGQHGSGIGVDQAKISRVPCDVQSLGVANSGAWVFLGSWLLSGKEIAGTEIFLLKAAEWVQRGKLVWSELPSWVRPDTAPADPGSVVVIFGARQEHDDETSSLFFLYTFSHD